MPWAVPLFPYPGLFVLFVATVLAVLFKLQQNNSLRLGLAAEFNAEVEGSLRNWVVRHEPGGSFALSFRSAWSGPCNAIYKIPGCFQLIKWKNLSIGLAIVGISRAVLPNGQQLLLQYIQQELTAFLPHWPAQRAGLLGKWPVVAQDLHSEGSHTWFNDLLLLSWNS